MPIPKLSHGTRKRINKTLLQAARRLQSDHPMIDLAISLHLKRQVHISLTKRWKLMADLKECATQDGFVFIEESGRDCDGTQYSGLVRKIKATPQALEALYDEINEWADGPFHLTILTQEKADKTMYISRDLALEAFEDGHPHCLHT